MGVDEPEVIRADLTGPTEAQEVREINDAIALSLAMREPLVRDADSRPAGAYQKAPSPSPPRDSTPHPPEQRPTQRVKARTRLAHLPVMFHPTGSDWANSPLANDVGHPVRPPSFSGVAPKSRAPALLPQCYPRAAAASRRPLGAWPAGTVGWRRSRRDIDALGRA